MQFPAVNTWDVFPTPVRRTIHHYTSDIFSHFHFLGACLALASSRGEGNAARCKASGSKSTEAYSLEYVEDLFRLRTTQMVVDHLPQQNGQCRIGSWNTHNNSIGTQLALVQNQHVSSTGVSQKMILDLYAITNRRNLPTRSRGCIYNHYSKGD
jgi:hypothetical protein